MRTCMDTGRERRALMRYWVIPIAMLAIACDGRGAVGPDGAAVTLDAAAAVTDTVGFEEVTLRTTSNGVQYVLTVPAAALPSPVRITMTPMRAAGGAIGKAGLVAGVRLEPEHLKFARAATLTIVPPGGTGTGRLAGVSAAGNGSAPFLVPVRRTDSSLTLIIPHFSTAAVVTDAAAIPAPPVGAIGAVAQSIIMLELGAASAGPVTSASLATIVAAFGTWYDASVRPKLIAGRANDTAAVAGLSDWTAWVTSLVNVSLELGDPHGSQVIAALIARHNAGHQLVGAMLVDAIARGNAACQSQAGNLSGAMQAAANVLYWQEVARFQGLAGTGAHQFSNLTLDVVLEELCLRIAYASVQFAPTVAIGERHPLVVRAGFSVGGSAPLFSAFPEMSVQPAGAKVASGQTLSGPTLSDGMFRTELEIEQDAVVINVNTCGPTLSRLHLICHDTLIVRSPSLSWTFDAGLEGWSVANAGRTYDRAQWISNIGNPRGAIWLDGSDFGSPDGEPNGWLFRTVQLPANATVLSFDTRGQQVGQDGALRVRIAPAGGQPQILLDWEVVGGTQWVGRTASIAAYAGRAVTIYFEQSDNDVGSGEGRFIDNIRILTSGAAQ